jgi:hypothetical protein
MVLESGGFYAVEQSRRRRLLSCICQIKDLNKRIPK